LSLLRSCCNRKHWSVRTQRFHGLLAAAGPFASIYFEDSHDTAKPQAELDVRWRDLRRLLEEQRAAPGLISILESAVLTVRPPVGRSGRGLVATAEGVLVDEHLAWSEPTAVVRVSELPFILPLVEHSIGAPAYLLVAVDHLGADISLHRGSVAQTESVDPGGYPVHKSSRADRGEYGEAQQRVDEMFRKNIRAVADRITAVADDADPQAVFVTGEVRSRAALMSALPQRVSQRAVAVHAGVRHALDQAQARAAIEAEFGRRRDAAVDREVQRFGAEKSKESGLAVEGLGPVCAALRDGAVDTLIVGDLQALTVVADARLEHIAPDADVLSELGAAPTRVLRADEALPLAAVSIDASVICAHVRLADGVGALLRYTEPGEAGVAAAAVANA
jgi:peptide chain release factor subunit 1